MGTQESDGYYVVPKGLSDAAQEFGQASSVIKLAASSYDENAAPVNNPFGMVEGASQQLANDYQSFFNNATQLLQDMWESLNTASGYVLPANWTNYTGAENASTVGGH